MNLPISLSSPLGLTLAGVFGLIFGVLLQRGGVTNYNVIANFFRLKDWTVMKIMLTAIVVGGVGVFFMMEAGLLEGYHIKSTQLLGLAIGGTIFGIGMATLGYCPGTGVAAIGTGSIHAFVGFLGMLVGSIAYAFSYPWVKANILSVGDLGKVRLSEVSSIPDVVWWIIIIAVALVVFRLLDKFAKSPA
jgi:uncharacterized membrane protein YedE/YeeE